MGYGSSLRLASVRVAARFHRGARASRRCRANLDRHRRLNAAPTIETARLRLRPTCADDLDVFAAMWSDPRVFASIGGAGRPRDDVWRRMLATQGHWDWFGYGYWTVERQGQIIGNAGFAEFHRPIDPPLDAPEAGYAYIADHWGLGYATEILAAMVAWADARGWPRTVAIIDPGNAAERARRREVRLPTRTRYILGGNAHAHFRARPTELTITRTRSLPPSCERTRPQDDFALHGRSARLGPARDRMTMAQSARLALPLSTTPYDRPNLPSTVKVNVS